MVRYKINNIPFNKSIQLLEKGKIKEKELLRKLTEKKKIFENYILKGYYGDYFINLIIYSKLKNYSIIELPFADKERSSGYSKTAPEFSFRYLVVCVNYILSLC